MRRPAADDARTVLRAAALAGALAGRGITVTDATGTSGRRQKTYWLC